MKRSHALSFLLIVYSSALQAQEISKGIIAPTPSVPSSAEAAPAVEIKKGAFRKWFGKDNHKASEVSEAQPESAPAEKSGATNKLIPAEPKADKIQALVNTPVDEGLKDDIEPKKPSHWRLGAGYAPILGMKADFEGTGNVPTTPNVAGQNREYLDGYVRVDSSGNFGGDTTFWGYGSSAQEVGGNIAFQSLAAGSSGSGGSNISDSSVSAAAGFELYGFYDMGSATIFGLKDKGATWGLRAGIQYANVDLNNGSSGSGTVRTYTDTFSLGGNPAPGACFAGTFAGPNQLLGDVALTRTFGGSANVQISGNRSLNVHLAISQWGSYLEIPVSKKLDLTLEGGFLLAVASGSYDYTNRVRVGSSGSGFDLQFGPAAVHGLGHAAHGFDFFNDDPRFVGHLLGE